MVERPGGSEMDASGLEEVHGMGDVEGMNWAQEGVHGG